MRIPPAFRLGQWLAGALLVLQCGSATADPPVRAKVLVHTALAAGLSHHEAKAVWDELKPGDALELVREPANPHDPNAVRVDWQSHVLGYLPRTDSPDIARQLDRGQPLKARIVTLARYRNHRRKLQMEIYLDL